MQNDSNNPWYREPWPWLLMVLPVCAVIAGAVTLWLAIASDDGLVADDYYKQGMAINKLLYREQVASKMQLQAQIQWHRESQLISATLTSANHSPLPAALRLRLLHPGQAGKDETLLLQKTDPGRYKSAFFHTGVPRWHLLLEDSDATWRLTGQWRIPDEQTIRLRPSRLDIN